MIAKKHEFEMKTILAVCDKEHLGKTFEDGAIFFEVKEKFYGGNTVSEKELEELLEECDSANLFGDKCVGVAIKKGLASEKSVRKISGIKHAQIYRV
jgi:hypothetical protein